MKNSLIAAGIAAAVVAGCATVDQTVNPMMQQQAAEWLKRDFHARGSAKMDRLDQDELQRACTQHDDKPPQAVMARIEQAEHAKLKLPSDGKFLGDWKRGQKIAQSGRGMTWNDKDPYTGNGGGCYNCHQLAAEETSFGTIGPSLNQFGMKRGFTAENQKYVYEKIYNSKAFSACSQMPRFGTSRTLNEQEIKDVTAYLMDPASPVNK